MIDELLPNYSQERQTVAHVAHPAKLNNQQKSKKTHYAITKCSLEETPSFCSSLGSLKKVEALCL